MSARLVGLLLLAIGAVAASALVATRLPHALTVPAAQPSPPAVTSPAGPPRPAPTASRRARHRPASGQARRRGDAQTPAPRHAPAGSDARFLGLGLPLLIALEVGASVLALGGLCAALTVRRARRRRDRTYALYDLHLSPHDEAKPQDLEDMLEAIANTVRAFPTDRARYGQPFVAVELHHGSGPSGEMEWSIAVRCEPTVAFALDAAISAAYPDTRLGHVLGETPQPRPERCRLPGYVMRFRKERGFIYPLAASGDELSSPPLEAIAHTQVTLGVPSVVRFQLTPAPSFFEEIARKLYRRHENKLVRQERWGLPEGGLTSTLNRAEMANAQQTQNRSLFWLELVIAADTRETCKQLAATVQARRGENRLHRRWMILRQDLYRRRFPAAIPPLVPSPRSLISAAEAAHLLEVPSARMKGVPVRRVAIPRIPMPPEILRAAVAEAVPTPHSAPPGQPERGGEQEAA